MPVHAEGSVAVTEPVLHPTHRRLPHARVLAIKLRGDFKWASTRLFNKWHRENGMKSHQVEALHHTLTRNDGSRT